MTRLSISCQPIHFIHWKQYFEVPMKLPSLRSTAEVFFLGIDMKTQFALAKSLMNVFYLIDCTCHTLQGSGRLMSSNIYFVTACYYTLQSCRIQYRNGLGIVLSLSLIPFYYATVLVCFKLQLLLNEFNKPHATYVYCYA